LILVFSVTKACVNSRIKISFKTFFFHTHVCIGLQSPLAPHYQCVV
jgi:hypothetical protein